MYVCLCNAISDHDIRSAIAEGCRSVPALCTKLSVATRCGQCRSSVEGLLQEAMPVQVTSTMPWHSSNPA